MLLGFVGMLGSAGGALLYWLSPQQASDSGQHHSVIVAKDSPVEADVLTQPISKTSIEQRLALGRQRRKGLALNEADFRLNIAKSELFEMSDAQTMADRNPRLMSNMQFEDGRVFIQNDPYVLESKTVGDTIAFTAVGYGLKRKGVIQQVHVDPKEDIVTWTGVLEGGDPNRELFSISQSLKDQFTAGTIQSQGKTYAVMVKNGYGWLKDLDQEAAALIAAEMQNDVQLGSH